MPALRLVVKLWRTALPAVRRALGTPSQLAVACLCILQPAPKRVHRVLAYGNASTR